MIIKIIRKILTPIVGKRSYQKLFEALNQFSLIGMNIGGGTNPKDNGEKYALDYVNKKLKLINKLIVFDVGANIGHYSLLLSEVLGDKAIIYSFEPSHRTFEKLSLNVGKKENIILHNFGFSDKEINTVLYSNQDESGLASVYKRRLDHLHINMEQSENIEIKTVDTFCKNNNIEHIHFLKLDVEGHEIKVLEGSSELLNSKRVDFIQFEFGGCNIDSRTYFKDFYCLLKDNYKIYRILKDGLYPIEQYREQYESFAITNYLAEKKF